MAAATKETDELPVEEVSDPALKCPDCDYHGKGAIPKADLGRHRFRAHGYRSTRNKGKTAASKRASAGPKEPKEPAARRRGTSAARSVTSGARKAGAIMSPRLPVTGAYLLDTADDLGKYLADIAADNPALLAWLERADAGMSYVAIASWGAGLLVSVGVDLDRVDPESVLANELGVTAITRRVDDALDNAEARRSARAAAGVVDVPPAGDPVAPTDLGEEWGAAIVSNGDGPSTVVG